jgi:16S rRNA processing protein RimM
MTKLKNPVQMAVIGAPHGVKGEVRVKTFTRSPLALGDYGPLYTEDGRAFDIAAIRPANTVVVVKFKQVTSREQAEALNGAALFVDRLTLPAGLTDDEFYQADLVGLVVEDENGARLGKVVAVHDFGGGDILEVALGGKHSAMIPFSAAAVPAIDLEAGIIRIDSVAAGLTGEDDPDAERDFDPERRPRGPNQAGESR